MFHLSKMEIQKEMQVFLTNILSKKEKKLFELNHTPTQELRGPLIDWGLWQCAARRVLPANKFLPSKRGSREKADFRQTSHDMVSLLNRLKSSFSLLCIFNQAVFFTDYQRKALEKSWRHGSHSLSWERNSQVALRCFTRP